MKAEISVASEAANWWSKTDTQFTTLCLNPQPQKGQPNWWLVAQYKNVSCPFICLNHSSLVSITTHHSPSQSHQRLIQLGSTRYTSGPALLRHSYATAGELIGFTLVYVCTSTGFSRFQHRADRKTHTEITS